VPLSSFTCFCVFSCSLLLVSLKFLECILYILVNHV
jgi:hypothetical protein